MPLSIAAYDVGGGQAYHFLTVAPSDRAGAAVDPLFASFRLLAPDEAAGLRPRVIRTVAAPAGASADTLAQAMADPNGRALLMLLNGWEPGRRVRPGERVKIVRFVGE